MDMNIVTPPKKGLKARPYSMDMEDHRVTLPKRGLKTRPYSIDMNKDIVTLPKEGLKTRPYNIDMEKKDLKKLTKGQLIKLVLIVYRCVDLPLCCELLRRHCLS